MKNIYISLIKSASPIGKAISFINQDEVTHAAIALDEDFQNLYAFGRKWEWCPFIGGFVKETYIDGYYGKFDYIYGKVIKISVTDRQYSRVKDIIEHFSINKHLYRYSIKKLLSNLIDVEIKDETSFICSEFVAYVLKHSGIMTCEKPLNLVTPQALLIALTNNNNCEVVYNGNMKYYVDINPDFNERGIS